MRNNFNMKIVAGKHLTVKAEFYEFVRVDIDCLRLTVYEMLAGLGVIQMFSCCINGEQAKETGQGGSLALTHLHEAVVILGTG